MVSPFQHPELRAWFFDGIDPTGMFPNGVSTTGSCPFDEYEYDSFLAELGIEALSPSFDLNILVIGREDWEEEHLNGVIEARRGKELRVYSQEMFLAYIAGGNDPLESPRVAEIFGEGHPALEHIKEWGFDWPTTRLVPTFSSPGITATGEWKEESFLKIMGYTAGAKGRDCSKRRSALHKAFVEELPEMSDANYVAEWGRHIKEWGFDGIRDAPL